MTTMISEIYDALVSAGAEESKARKPAEAVAAYEHRFANIEGRLSVLTWMSGTIIALVIGVVVKLFIH